MSEVYFLNVCHVVLLSSKSFRCEKERDFIFIRLRETKKKWVEKEKYESNSINSSGNREIKYYVCGTIFNGLFYHISYICFPHINSHKTKSKTYFE